MLPRWRSSSSSVSRLPWRERGLKPRREIHDLCDARRMAGFRFSVYRLRFADYDVRAFHLLEMMFMRLPTLLACLAVSASVVIACRGGDDDTKTPDGGGSNGSGGFVKIQDVQNDAMPPQTPV